MHHCYYLIQGSGCNACYQDLIENVKAYRFVKSVRLRCDVLDTEVTDEAEQIADEEGIAQLIRRAVYTSGYTANKKEYSWDTNPWRFRGLLRLVFIVISLFVLFALKNTFFEIGLLQSIPSVNTQMTRASVVVIGLLSGVHCIGMCGAICLAVSKSKKSALLYNLGRIASYTVIGGTVGLLGSLLQINRVFLSWFTVVVALIMVLIGLSMNGIIHIPYPNQIKNRQIIEHSAVLVGFLNGFIPCSSLQAVQIYALTTGSAYEGAITMLLFGIGTLPMMLGISFIKQYIKSKSGLFEQIAGVLIVFLAVAMLLRGLNGTGIMAKFADKNLDNYLVSEVIEDKQYVTSDLKKDSFGDIAVKKGIPVIFTIEATSEDITGCNHEIISSDFGFDVMLSEGSNIVEFLPTEKGDYTMSCHMNMIVNTIHVY